MIINDPTYLIAELAGDVVDLVTDCRQRFNPDHDWPVDITLAGSSGIGTIEAGQSLAAIIDVFSPIIEAYRFIDVRFLSAERFPNTGIYYLAPERDHFDNLHHAITKSGVRFNSNPWPYNPHCTLRADAEPTHECDQLIEELTLPNRTNIECFSLYQPFSGNGRLHRF